MKTSVFPFSAKLLAIIFFSFAIFCSKDLQAQAGGSIQVTLPTGVSTNQAYSPSITSFKATTGSAHFLVTAYAYTYTSSGSTYRRVGISRSTDGGTTWPTSASYAIAKPYWYGSGFSDPGTGTANILDNVDDPQVRWISGFGNSAKLVCVVRAWSSDQTTMVGQTTDGAGYLEQPYSIFKKCGIYLTVSTDGGQTWGYPNSSGTWTTDRWAKIDETGYSGSSTPVITLENPRITDQQFGQNQGYIVWEKKQWSAGTTSGTYAVDGTNTKIGIAAYDASAISSTEGQLIKTAASSGTTPQTYISFSGFSGTAPERPSVAIAPDFSIWISFYSLNLPASGIGTDNPEMYVYISNGHATLNSSNQISYTFHTSLTSDQLVNGGLDPAQRIFGRYDPNRGYVYATFPSWDPITQGRAYDNSRDFGFKSDKEVNDWDYDFAAGPAIEVVSNPPLNGNCTPDYWVGVAYTNTFDGSEGNAADYDAYYPCRSFLSFYSAKARPDPSNTMGVGTLAAGKDIEWVTINRSAKLDWDHSNAKEFQHVPNNYFFPSLTFTQDQFEGSTYFVLGFMAGNRKSSEAICTGCDQYSPRCFKYVACHTGVSYDNQTFRMTNWSDLTGGSDQGMLEAAEDFNTDPGWVDPADPTTGFWGTKIGVCGNTGSLEVHSVWHQIIPDMMSLSSESTSEILRTNVARGILLKTYIKGAPRNDPASFINGGMLSPVGGIFNPDATGANWADFGYFNFFDGSTFLREPTAITAKSSITVGTTSYSFLSFQSPTGGSSPFPFGEREAWYGTATDQTLGQLNFSDQRKVAATGNMLHTVYERVDQNGIASVFYTFNTPTFSYGISFPWGQEIQLNTVHSPATQPNPAFHPSIAVYQKGNGSDFDGKAAVGVTWTEVSGSTVF